MKGGRQRKEVKQRQGDRRQIRVMLLWSFCIAIVFKFYAATSWDFAIYSRISNCLFLFPSRMDMLIKL